MSDREFERRVARALRAPVATDAREKSVIMDRVRLAARESASRTAFAFPLGRTTRQSLIGVALAAGIGSITTLSALLPVGRDASARGVVTSAVIGDSVVDRLRDTLRLVRLMFDDRSARQVAVIGDFNAWRAGATQMRRDGATGRWSVTIALRDGEHRYAVVVDNARLAGSATARPRDASGGAYSILHVARVTN